uniref:Uncharacterized protein n=1 Tax=Panagrolaimus sp. PS1159 TaxID=55785 RepID=A0AC35FUD0_9BILA
MSTPLTFKEREESIARKKGQKNRQQRQQWQPTFSAYKFEALPSNRQHYTCYSDGKFGWDDWTTAPPPLQRQIIQPPSAQNIVYKDIKIDKDNIFVFHGKDSYMSTFFEV